VIGSYERDEMPPSIEAAREIAQMLGTTVGYLILIDETEQENLFKDPYMLRRLNEIEKMDKEDKNHILFAIDAFIKIVKLKKYYGTIKQKPRLAGRFKHLLILLTIGFHLILPNRYIPFLTIFFLSLMVLQGCQVQKQLHLLGTC